MHAWTLSSQKILTEQRTNEPQGETGQTGRKGEKGGGQENAKREEKRKEKEKEGREAAGMKEESSRRDPHLEAEAGAVGGETIRGTFEDRPRVFPVEGC